MASSESLFTDEVTEVQTTAQLEEAFQEINTIVSKIEAEKMVTILYYCDQMLEMSPQDIMTLYTKGKILLHQGYYSHAIATLMEVEAQAPESQTIMDDLDFARKKLAVKDESQGEQQNNAAGNNPLQRKISISWKWLIGRAAVAFGGVGVCALLSNGKATLLARRSRLPGT